MAAAHAAVPATWLPAEPSRHAASRCCPQDIGRAFWEGQGKGKREKRQRLVKVDGFDILRSNMYSLTEVRAGWGDGWVRWRHLGMWRVW